MMLFLLAPDLQVDWRIQGEGYFRLLDGERQAYTRDGRFHVGPAGLLRSGTGLPLDPPVRVPDATERLAVAEDGTILAIGPSGSREIGRLVLAKPTADGQFPIIGPPGSPGFGRVTAGGSVPAASGVAVTVAEQADANGPEILLGDIATIVAPPGLAERLAAVSVGASPLAGGSRALTRDQVETKLRAAGHDPDKLSLDMPRSVVVRRPAREVAADELIEAARAALEGAGADLTGLAAQAGVRSVRVPSGGYELKARSPTKGGAGWSVPVTVYSGTRPVATTMIRFVAARTAPAEPVVNAGDQVTVRILSGSLTVETAGIVRQRGAAGEQVNVYLPTTNKTVRAEVIDSGTVKVTT